MHMALANALARMRLRPLVPSPCTAVRARAKSRMAVPPQKAAKKSKAAPLSKQPRGLPAQPKADPLSKQPHGPSAWTKFSATPTYARAKEKYLGGLFNMDALMASSSFVAPPSPPPPSPSPQEPGVTSEPAPSAEYWTDYLLEPSEDSAGNGAAVRDHEGDPDFSFDEDRTIAEMAQMRANWLQIATAVGRTEEAVRARYEQLTGRSSHNVRGGIVVEQEPAVNDEKARAMAAAATWRTFENNAPWSDEERLRLLEAIAERGKDWIGIAWAVGHGRLPDECAAMATVCFEWQTNDSTATAGGTGAPGSPFTAEEDAALVAAVASARNDWARLAQQFGGRTPTSLRERYAQLLPRWLRTNFTPRDRRLVEEVMHTRGPVGVALFRKFANVESARGWVALYLGMDGAEQVNWEALDEATVDERVAAVSAQYDLRHRLPTEAWKEGARVQWVPSWNWPRPICTGRPGPIVEVATHPAIAKFVIAV